MTKRELTIQLLTAYPKDYPLLQPEDVFKYLFHSTFGCEHMVSSLENAVALLRKEAATVPGRDLVECLDGGKYARVHLGYLNNGMTAQTLGKLFVLSAKREENGLRELMEKLAVAEELAEKGVFPFSYDVFTAALGKWKREGYPPVHHSQAYRDAYHPAYRVIAGRFVPYLEVLAKIDGMLERGPVRLAIDGGSASGKTTFAAMLEEIYGCTVIHTDDFFLQAHQRTPERYAQAGGNLDRERLLEEVLLPLSRNEPVTYRKFDCGKMELGEPVVAAHAKLTVIEGTYSLHPELAGYYDLSVVLETSPQCQRRRIQHRNTPAMAQRFFEEWIPMENRYFQAMDVKNRCWCCIRNDE